MSLEELKQDAAEFDKLLGTTTRIRVKDALITAKALVDKEILNLEIKSKQEAQRNAVGADSIPKRYLSELTEYAWDQSDKYVKLFVTLNDVQNLDESSVVVNFTPNSMHLLVINMNGKDYALTVNNLLEQINVESSYRKVKTNMIAIYMKKLQEGKQWETLTTIQKRLKDIKDQEFKTAGDDDNPENALVNIMKKMYNSGDAKTKQMIAKAWTESQEKAMKNPGGNRSDSLDL